ncbi:biotin/lipoyl-containing protein [Clostridium felsineum]|uniref:Biotin carboxyl carrier protein of acetyl-CoA carboxylase n=1 Tax=Clostridium felsineum TaxID=36839 RepID=A0A1S8L7A7_9CLOT|nr:biotin/lipoyl-containing protein [Clostridium felsineum]URZ07170.1 Biotin carboxyl carrier protein of acetyl-CoA carboxylase [Clostridium felsineum]URZ12199.1 Biotin carboxyl carrier protein of acetyl-CoA carboxylase [Clostridium felsineum]URZ16790.1 Biotin carboxyl carrier protein of acetyl-CoA carboxylase [Clostridium felsineum DSM 794]
MIENLEDIIKLCEQSKLGYFKYGNGKEQIVFSKASTEASLTADDIIKDTDSYHINNTIISESSEDSINTIHDNDTINIMSSDFVGVVTYSDLLINKEKNIEVKKGDLLCTVEAMKLSNEILAKDNGVIEEILVNNGDIVEYGQELFRIRVNVCD